MGVEPILLPDEEFVLRRIHKNQVDAGPPAVVAFTGFRPTSEDIAGLSVYREKLVSAAQLAASGRKPGEYFVAGLPVQSLREMRLTVIADEQVEGPAGHSLIPELSIAACQQEKAKLREIQLRLAELASENIVHYPD